MTNHKNYILICKPALSEKESDKFYILESLEGTDGSGLEEMTLIGDVGLTGHVVGLENTYADAEKTYKQFCIGAEYRQKHFTR